MHNLQCRYVIERLKGGKDGIEIDQMVRLTACYAAEFLKPEV